MKSIKSFASKYPVIILLLLILTTSLIVYHDYFFNHFVFVFTDAGSDTQQQYIPLYNSLVRHIQNGDFSFYDLSYGFGSSMFNMNLFHPTLMLLYLLGVVFGVRRIGMFLIAIFVLDILLTGLAMYLYLSCFRLSKQTKVIVAWIYSFNGYMVIWGQHYHLALCSCFLVLLLFAVERSLQQFSSEGSFSLRLSEKKSRRAALLIPLVVGMITLSSYYQAYMVVVICAVYTVIRILMLQSLGFLKKFALLIRRGLLMVLGLLIGMVYMLPSFMIISESSTRLSSNLTILQKIRSTLKFFTPDYYLTFLKKMSSNSLQGNGYRIWDYSGYGNYYEAPQLFLTCLAVILLIQFLIFFPKVAKTLRQRIMLILSGIVMLVICFLQVGGLIFNGFAYPFSRHTFVVLPFIAVLIAFMLEFCVKNKRFSRIGGAAAIAFYAAMCIPALWENELICLQVNAVIQLATSTALVIVLALLSNRSTVQAGDGAKQKAVPHVRGRIVLPVLFVLLLGVQLVSDTYTTVNSRASVERPNTVDNEFYGEKMAAIHTWLNEHDSSLYRLEKTYVVGTMWMDALQMDYYGVSTYNSTMNKNLIEFIEKMLPDIREKNEGTTKTNYRYISERSAFTELFGIKYILSTAKIDYPGYTLAATIENVFIYENENTTFASFYTDAIPVSLYEEEYGTENADEAVESYLVLDEAEDCTITSAEELNTDTETSDSDVTLDMPDPEEEGHLTCSVDTNQDGYVFIPIPYESGWEITVDGTQSEILRADYGFMAVKVAAGTHTIQIDYEVPYLTIGGMTSLVGLALWLLLFIVTKKRERNLANG